jgi:predicted DNA-binding helix-hairpin-helix protein
MDLMEKLTILTDAAKYDAACTSSGVEGRGRGGVLGSATMAGCCHSFSADGRCVTLLKVLLSNCCAYDCQYCVNRRSAETRRASFTPRELAELTIEFYRRNYIEGLFLSSSVVRDPDYTTEQMIRALRILREDYGFRRLHPRQSHPRRGRAVTYQLGLLADRLSVNIELPSEASLRLLARKKTKGAISAPWA